MPNACAFGLTFILFYFSLAYIQHLKISLFYSHNCIFCQFQQKINLNTIKSEHSIVKWH